MQKMPLRIKIGWVRFPLLLSVILLTACETATFKTVKPPIVTYSEKVQNHAADELEAMGPPCPRDDVYGECSAVKRMVIDYKDVRNKIRAAE